MISCETDFDVLARGYDLADVRLHVPLRFVWVFELSEYTTHLVSHCYLLAFQLEDDRRQISLEDSFKHGIIRESYTHLDLVDKLKLTLLRR